MEEEELYQFAVGYYDGRANGFESGSVVDHTLMYKAGYLRGVADYCEIDEPEATESV